MEIKGFTFKEDMTMRRFYEIAGEKDVAVQMREIAAELSVLGRQAFLDAIMARPMLEGTEIISTIFFTYMQRMRDGGERVARDLAPHASS